MMGNIPIRPQAAVVKALALNVQPVTHQGACWCINPIHKAHAETSAKAEPDKRIPQRPSPIPTRPSCNQNQGPTIRVSEVPSANSAIVTAPANGSADKDASSNAEYKSPQGNKDHTTPSPKGAASKPPAATLRTRTQTLRAPTCSHRGCRPVNNSTSPRTVAATCKSDQTGRSATDCTESHPKPCTDAAASAPSAA